MEHPKEDLKDMYDGKLAWEKVKSIYKMGLKHGMKLAAISGVNGVFSNEDIEKVRDLAIAAREKNKTVKKK